MRAVCKLCQAVIETEPDSVFDKNRDKREENMFWNRVAFHIDPNNNLCRFDPMFVRNRFVMVQDDNGKFQRFRLLACLTDLDQKLVDKQESCREYLHTITSIEASCRAPESTDPPPSGSAKTN